jgi:hypothetical protein
MATKSSVDEIVGRFFFSMGAFQRAGDDRKT